MDERDTLEFYRAKDGIRWRYQAAGNNEVLADSGQGYDRLAQAEESANRVTGRRVEGDTATLVAGAGRDATLKVEYQDGLG